MASHRIRSFQLSDILKTMNYPLNLDVRYKFTHFCALELLVTYLGQI